MRILCVCYEDMSGFIGGTRQVINIADGLAELGHSVQICAPLIGRYKGKTRAKLIYVPVTDCRRLRPFIYNIFAPFCLLWCCINFKPDCLLTYEIFFSPTSLIISKMFNLPNIVFVNGSLEDFRLQGCSRFVLRCLNALRKVNLRYASRIITVTQGLKNEISDNYGVLPEKITIVNNGVDADEFKPMDKEYCCEKLGLDSNIKYIGFLGGIYPWHGLDALVKSAPYVLKEFSDVKYIIAGHGPLREGLINLVKDMGISEYFIFPGEVPFESAPLWLNTFDVAALFFKPVRKNQGNPIKLYEYLACARPVIASDISGYGDFVERVGAGMPVNLESPEDISTAIIRLFKDSELRKKMGDSGREMVIKDYTWVKTAEKIINR